MGLFCGFKRSLEHRWGSFEEIHALRSQQVTDQQQIRNIWGFFAHLEGSLAYLGLFGYRALLRKYLPATGKQVNGKLQIFRARLRKYSFLRRKYLPTAGGQVSHQLLIRNIWGSFANVYGPFADT